MASGCLEKDGRPYDEYLADLADLVDAGPKPDAGPPLCTESDGAPITVVFTNRTGRNGQLVWANHQCTTIPYAMINNGQSAMQQTFVGHAWRLVRSNTTEILDQVVIADGQTSVTFE